MPKSHELLYFMIIPKQLPSTHYKVDPHWPANETPFEWRFASGPMVASHCVLTGLYIPCLENKTYTVNSQQVNHKSPM